MKKKDTEFMKIAYKEALIAMNKGEVPVGAVIVKNDKIIGKGHNMVETLKDATAHAEIIAITAASRYMNNWRLDGSTLYVTLEPCIMCAGAIILSRISRVVYGAKDEVLGAFGSVLNIMNFNTKRKLAIIGGVMEKESADLLRQFFKERRRDGRAD